MKYQPPVSAILNAMQTAGRLGPEFYPEFSAEDAEAILTEAGKFAAMQIAPLNRVGDKEGARFENGRVTTPTGWKSVYRSWSEAGWNGLTGPTAYGGQELPMIIAVACTEIWNAACLSFALNPLLTAGAIEAISAHATPELKERYLPNLVSGNWTGTMNLTEPQSGSDLSGLRCKAQRSENGSYSISGTKIYITYGEHDCSDNIIHLVLARLSDAPAGTRGISLFLVPKILPDGSLNDLRCHSIENKLGIHASPTCTMIYGDNGGATGWLIGEENRGLNCMFTMMNTARLLVGVQGVGIADRSTQAAIAYARERRQGRAPGSDENPSRIIAQPDVKRMLLDMSAKTSAARMLCMATASAIDESLLADDQHRRRKALTRASLLTPLAKSFATDIAVEVASTGIQVHGGMGFMEDTGAAQFYRDARILPIYEGTNGIQAIDLVTRKLSSENGEALAAELEQCEEFIARTETAFGSTVFSVALKQALGVLRTSAAAIAAMEPALALSAATSFQRALASSLAGGYLVNAACEARSFNDQQQMLATANFFIATEVVATASVCEMAVSCATVMIGMGQVQI
jgi:acyl-CoA dehydrogenase